MKYILDHYYKDARPPIIIQRGGMGAGEGDWLPQWWYYHGHLTQTVKEDTLNTPYPD